MATRLTSRRGLSLGLAVLRTSQLCARLASVQDCKGLKRCQVRPDSRWAILLLTAAASLWAGRAAVAVEPVPQVAGLPSDAQALLDGYQKKSAPLQAEIDRQVAEAARFADQIVAAAAGRLHPASKARRSGGIRDQLRIIKSKMATAGQSVVPPAVGAWARLVECRPSALLAECPVLSGYYEGSDGNAGISGPRENGGPQHAFRSSDADKPSSMTPFRNSMGDAIG